MGRRMEKYLYIFAQNLRTNICS